MLSDETKAAIRREVARYPQKKTALLPSLKLAQKETGYLSSAVLEEVADEVGVPSSCAVELATFYSMLFTEKVAPVRVEVCVQLPCALRGAEQTAEDLAKPLGIELTGPAHKRHGHTGDHLIELHTTVECFGSCHRAPMCRVGDDYREHLDADGQKKLVEELKARALDAKKKGAH